MPDHHHNDTADHDHDRAWASPDYVLAALDNHYAAAHHHRRATALEHGATLVNNDPDLHAAFVKRAAFHRNRAAVCAAHALTPADATAALAARRARRGNTDVHRVTE